MLDIKKAKIDMLIDQTNLFLKTLAKTIEVSQNDLKIKVSAELEFYIVGKKQERLNKQLTIESPQIKNIIKQLSVETKNSKKKSGNINKKNNKNRLNNKSLIESFEAEDGFNQFEVQFFPTNDPVELAESIVNFKEKMQKITNVDFRAKPYKTEPTSSLHFHVSVYYKNVNLFAKDSPVDSNEYYYMPLYWCIAGMLKLMPKFIKYFAPTDNCRERYWLPKKEQKFIHYPTHVCWGFNNRTCAIRVPRKPSEDQLNCRIEHRVSSSMADPYLALFAIIAGMHYGVAKQLDCPEPVYERAFESDDSGQKITDLFL